MGTVSQSHAETMEQLGHCLPGVTTISEWEEVRSNRRHFLPWLLAIRRVWYEAERLELLRIGINNRIGFYRGDWAVDERALRDVDTVRECKVINSETLDRDYEKREKEDV